MEQKEKNKLRKLLQKIVGQAGGKGIILAHSEAGTQEYNLALIGEPDCKSPEDWLNSIFFFHKLKKEQGNIKLEYKK